MNIMKLAMNIIFPLIMFPYASRILLPEGIGRISFAFSIVSFFMLFALLGIPTYGIRVCAQVRDDRVKLSKTVKELFLINVVMTVIVYIVLLISLFMVDKFSSDKLLYIVCGSAIVLNSCGMDWLFQALEQYRYITIRSFIFKMLGLILLVIFVRNSSDYIMYAAICVISSYGSNIMNLIFARKYIDFRSIGVKLEIIKHIKPIVIIFSITAAASIYMNLDITMLGFMKDNTAVGYYDIAIKIETLILSFVTALGVVLLPRTTYYLENSMYEKYIIAIEKALNYVKIVALPLTIFFIFAAKKCILILAGKSYIEAIPTMQVIMPVVMLSGFSSIIGMQIFISNGKEKYLLIVAITGAIIDIIANYILIPNYSATGSALATTITEFIVLMIEIYFARNILSKIKISFTKTIVACSISTVSFLIISKCEMGNIFMQFILEAFVFFGTYFITMIFMKEELIVWYFNKIINRIRGKEIEYE